MTITAIKLHNELEVELDGPMLDFTMTKVAQHTAPGRTREIDIYVDARKPDGWLEWAMNIQYFDGGKLFIGLIQRELGAVFESHT